MTNVLLITVRFQTVQPLGAVCAAKQGQDLQCVQVPLGVFLAERSGGKW
jgi:hypothetical protein